MKITDVMTLEDDDGNVMCRQTTEWFDMSRSHALLLEASKSEWFASLPRTIGAETVTKKGKS